MTYEEWQKILAVNLTGPMLCIKAVAPAMQRTGGGRIVNIASVAGLAPSGSSIPYAVSKAGLIHLTRCMAVGLAPAILVNCIAPGYLEGTRATANLNPAYRDRARDAALLKRAADKDDVANQVVALCQTDSITGADPGDRCGAVLSLGPVTLGADAVREATTDGRCDSCACARTASAPRSSSPVTHIHAQAPYPSPQPPGPRGRRHAGDRAQLIAFAIALYFVKPAPPNRIVMASAQGEGRYTHYAKLYQQFLAKNGVTLELRPSSGASRA